MDIHEQLSGTARLPSFYRRRNHLSLWLGRCLIKISPQFPPISGGCCHEFSIDRIPGACEEGGTNSACEGNDNVPPHLSQPSPLLPARHQIVFIWQLGEEDLEGDSPVFGHGALVGARRAGRGNGGWRCEVYQKRPTIQLISGHGRKLSQSGAGNHAYKAQVKHQGVGRQGGGLGGLGGRGGGGGRWRLAGGGVGLTRGFKRLMRLGKVGLDGSMS
ncbi:hypothetical protein BaRGS_00040521 [Batillaria attramentaria]|uniref:Uncharacterized protein n=1 Tax=Batillaria attramentaria TaxID=370345 RepID=A0ABD0IZU5_9CAEN